MNRPIKLMELNIKDRMQTKLGKKMARDLEKDITTQTELIISAISKLSPLEQEVFSSYQEEFFSMMNQLIADGKHKEGLTPETVIAICFYVEILAQLIASSGTILLTDLAGRHQNSE